MSIFQWNSDYYDNNESDKINDILQREKRLREFSRLTDAYKASQQLYEDTVNVTGSFYHSNVINEEPSYDQIIAEKERQMNMVFSAADQDQDVSEEDFNARNITPSFIIGEDGWEVGFKSVPMFLPLDSNKDAMWMTTWGTGESNRSVWAVNSQASYLRSQLYTTSPFTQRSLSGLTQEERQLIPGMSSEIEGRIKHWQEFENNWEKAIQTFLEWNPVGLITKGIQGKAPSLDGIPFLDHFQLTPDNYFANYKDPNFNGEAVLELLKQYEPERYLYLQATGMDFNKLSDAKSIFDFYYHANDHITKVAVTNAMLDYQASDPGWIKNSWALYVRPFISGTFNDGDMPADLAITALTLTYGGAYVLAKNAGRFWKGATTARRIENTVRMTDSLRNFKRFQETATLLTPTNWATIVLNKGTHNFAENLAKIGTKGKVTSYIAHNAVEGALEGAAYYQLNYMMNIGTNAEYNWDTVEFLKEVGSEAGGQVVLGPIMNFISSLGMNATTATAKHLWSSFKPGNIGVEIEPSKVKRLFNDVTTALKIDPEKWDLLSADEKKEVAAAIDLQMQLQNLTEIVQGREDTTPYIINSIWNQYENSITKAIAVDALKEVALVIQGRTDDSKLDPKTKEFIKAVKDKYGDKLSSLQIGALLLEAVQIRTSQAMLSETVKSDTDASQILGNLTILSVLEDKANEMKVKLTTSNVTEIRKALLDEGQDKLTERFIQKQKELDEIAALRPNDRRVDPKSDLDQELTAADQLALDRILRLKPNEKIPHHLTTSEGRQAIEEARRVEREKDKATEQLIKDARAQEAEEILSDEQAIAADEATAPEATAPEAMAPEAMAPEATAPEAMAPEATAPEAMAPETTPKILSAKDALYLNNWIKKHFIDNIKDIPSDTQGISKEKQTARKAFKDSIKRIKAALARNNIKEIATELWRLGQRLEKFGNVDPEINEQVEQLKALQAQLDEALAKQGIEIEDPTGQPYTEGLFSVNVKAWQSGFVEGKDAHIAKVLTPIISQNGEVIQTADVEAIEGDPKVQEENKVRKQEFEKRQEERETSTVSESPSDVDRATAPETMAPEAIATEAITPEAIVTEDKPITMDADINTIVRAITSLTNEQQELAVKILDGITDENRLYKLETLMREIPETAAILKVLKDC